MKIILDAMGIENKVACATIAARNFVKRHLDAKVILAGDENEIKKTFLFENEFEILATKDYIKQTDSTLVGLRKTKSSFVLSLNKLCEKQVDAFVSGCSTSCFVPIVYNTVNFFPSIDKFGFMPFVPIGSNKGFYLIDCGANLSVSGKDLYKFALMANLYTKENDKISHPRIGILNIGIEQHKGFPFHKEANTLLLANKDLNYVGFIEPKNLFNDCVDILLTDAYSGNIFIKTIEGTLKFFGSILKKKFNKPWNIFTLLSLRKLKKYFDYRNKAAAIVLGINSIIIKTHGSSDEVQFYFALEKAYECVKNNIINKLNKQNYNV